MPTDRAEPAVALAAMQDINAAVRNALFGIGFFGAALIAATLAIRSVLAARPAGIVRAGAALVHLVGVAGVTALGNVPLNEALAAMADHLRDWTELNHVWSVGRTGPAAA